MVDLVEEMKQRARVLQRRAQRGDERARSMLGSASEDEAAADGPPGEKVLRRQALSALALHLGFRGWPHARDVLSGAAVRDRGTLMHRESSGMWNIWSADYVEARDVRRQHGGYLLGYKHQFVIVEAPFIEWLGLRPDDPDWERIGRDWVAPGDREAWSRLTACAIDARLGGRL